MLWVNPSFNEVLTPTPDCLYLDLEITTDALLLYCFILLWTPYLISVVSTTRLSVWFVRKPLIVTILLVILNWSLSIGAWAPVSS